MRFKEFLTENYVVKENFMTEAQHKKFLEDCKPFIDIADSVGYPHKCLYRGVRRWSGMPTWTIQNAHIGSRKPLHSNEEIHNVLNVAFEKVFHWPVRDGVFVSSSKAIAKKYGAAWYFVPIGRFRYCWSPQVDDLYISDFYARLESISNPEKQQRTADNIVKGYKQTNLKEAIESQHEISFECDKYYIFDAGHIMWEDLFEEDKYEI